MSLILRSVKGSKLSIDEMDNNLIYLASLSSGPAFGPSGSIPFYDNSGNLTASSLFTRHTDIPSTVIEEQFDGYSTYLHIGYTEGIGTSSVVVMEDNDGNTTLSGNIFNNSGIASGVSYVSNTGTASSFSVDISGAKFTSNSVNFALPKSDGTYSNFLATDGSGNLYFTASASPVPSYKIYGALIGFNGSTFSISQLENTIGDGSNDGVHDIAWSNPNNGVIKATMAISGYNGPFTTHKTVAMCGDVLYSPNFYDVIPQYYGSPLTAYVLFNMIKNDGTQLNTPSFSNLFVEIRVYN